MGGYPEVRVIRRGGRRKAEEGKRARSRSGMREERRGKKKRGKTEQERSGRKEKSGEETG